MWEGGREERGRQLGRRGGPGINGAEQAGGRRKRWRGRLSLHEKEAGDWRGVEAGKGDKQQRATPLHVIPLHQEGCWRGTADGRRKDRDQRRATWIYEPGRGM